MLRSLVGSEMCIRDRRSMELEHSLLRCPWEKLNLAFRSGHKLLDKHMTDALAAVEALPSHEQPVQALEGLVESLAEMKRKLQEMDDEEVQVIALSQQRMDHVQAVEEGDEGAKRARIHRGVVDWLLRSGMADAGRDLARQTGVEELVEIQLYDELHVISKALKAHDIRPALQWCHTNRSRLRKAASPLECQLQLQQVVVLIKADRRIEAVRHLQKHVGSLPENSLVLEAIKKVTCSLVLPPSSLSDTHAWFSDQRWEALDLLFEREFRTMNALPECSGLELALQVGLSGIKSPWCGKPSKYPSCPACHLAGLAERLPLCAHAQSSLLCPITMKVMDDPVVLPSGYVYSAKALAERVDQRSGRVRCPESGLWFDMSADARRAFVI
eukprot:TRINITY_DN1311_c0_g1_i4.p1 TRINITY_DN1311_c0_g1~~TRINITY_DN1311_c0_g1_i4.p1  ORF type:complete len:420 (+),score=114.91 TRINITY_DN1311_c0_g1_i4:107-1261(+)